MTENLGGTVLGHLSAIRCDIGGIKDDVREIKQRLASLEGAVAGLKCDQAASYTDTADQHARYDRLAERVEGIERRLDLSDSGGSPPR
jgi:hypothetical protein